MFGVRGRNVRRHQRTFGFRSCAGQNVWRCTRTLARARTFVCFLRTFVDLLLLSAQRCGPFDTRLSWLQLGPHGIEGAGPPSWVPCPGAYRECAAGLPDFGGSVPDSQGSPLSAQVVLVARSRVQCWRLVATPIDQARSGRGQTTARALKSSKKPRTRFSPMVCWAFLPSKLPHPSPGLFGTSQTQRPFRGPDFGSKTRVPPRNRLFNAFEGLPKTPLRLISSKKAGGWSDPDPAALRSPSGNGGKRVLGRGSLASMVVESSVLGARALCLSGCGDSSHDSPDTPEPPAAMPPPGAVG